MQVNVPPKVRLWLYIATGVLSPVVAVLTQPDIAILPAWVGLIWAGEMIFVSSLAAFNTPNKGKE